MVRLSVSVSVTVVTKLNLNKIKAVGWNKMPFRRDTRAVTSNIVLDCDHSHPVGRGNLGGQNPLSKFGLQTAAKLLQIAEWLL